MNLIIRNVVLSSVAVVAGGHLCAQTLTDMGSAAPTPGTNDISQFSTQGNTAYPNKPDNLNYYTDNNPPPGQTFTTGTNAMRLVSVALKTAGLNSGGGYGTPTNTPTYYLSIYSMSGSTATSLVTVSAANPGFTDGDWLKWSGLNVALAANKIYAFSFGRQPGSGGYAAMAVATNAYAGGEIALIPISGGTITTGSSHKYDAVFDLGMGSTNPPAVAALVITPTNVIYLGSSVTITSSASGSAPLALQWQTDGGGGTLTNIPAATNLFLTNTPSRTGTIEYALVVTNYFGSITNAVATVMVLPLPGTANVSVNLAQTMSPMPSAGLGVCTATYDNTLINTNVAPRLKAAGITAVRYPGGSYADIFNWQTTTANDGGYVNSSDSFTNFMNTVVNPAGAQAIITVNYGSNPTDTGGGDTNVAAAWVAFANVTNHWGVKYWEIGNEVGGNGYYGGSGWEYDLHYPYNGNRNAQPALSPAAYGTNAVQFISAMKAKDSTIKCGVGFDTGNSTYNSQVLGVCGSVVDFVIIHYYPDGDAATQLTQPAQIPSIVNNTLTQLTNIVGAAHAAQMQIAVTETGAGTNTTGAVVSLFAADNYLTWIENGIVNVDFQILHDDFLQTANQQPGHAYYGAQMCRLLANIGDTMLTATSDQSLVRVHAVSRSDGKVGVMLINTDPAVTNSVTVTIAGTNLASSGVRYQFGLTNFISVANDLPSYPVTTNSVSGLGNQFTASVPPYTIVNFIIPILTNTPPILSPITSQTVNVGQTVAFTASATDTDQPPPTLTFALLVGATNATLTTNSGAFLFRPLVTQANSTNTFTLQVSDNGAPPLIATQSFAVMVNPAFSAPVVSNVSVVGGQFQFQRQRPKRTRLCNCDFDQPYAVEQRVHGKFARAAVQLDPDTNFNSPQRFYRVKLGPAPAVRFAVGLTLENKNDRQSNEACRAGLGVLLVHAFAMRSRISLRRRATTRIPAR